MCVCVCVCVCVSHLLVSVDAQVIGALGADKRWTPGSGVVSRTCSTTVHHEGGGAGTRGETGQNTHSPGRSTLITSAPRSPRIMVANGPARTLQTRDTSLKPDSRRLSGSAVLDGLTWSGPTLSRPPVVEVLLLPRDRTRTTVSDGALHL